MAEEMKLIYFNLRGFAEVTRLILAEAGVEYEDVRLTREEWAKIKAGKNLIHFCAKLLNGRLA